MTYLTIGKDKTPILDHLPESFLLIDDGPLIDRLVLPPRRKVTRLDFSRHALNPVKDMSYTKARLLLSVFDAVFPEGANTLTKKNADFVLLKALLAGPKRLDTMLAPSKDPAEQDAYQKVETLLLSPVLKSFLCRPTNFPLSGIIIAKLDRAAMSEFDCFVLGNILIGHYNGQVVVPDFGFYGRAYHSYLIRQDRLIAGVDYLSETPLKDTLLLMDGKEGHSCTYEDAALLAAYRGLIPHTNEFNSFVEAAVA